MKKLLHIIATPRGEESRTLQVTNVFLKAFKEKNTDWAVDEIDLSKEKLPNLNLKETNGKYILLGGKELYGEFKKAWQDIIAQIQRFLSADAYLISSPMWNFSIPYTLKHYIDVILQPKYLFRYTPTGPEGLVKNKKMAIITSRGGEYLSEQMHKIDFQEPYLRAIFGLAGISDITFIHAQPMDMGPDIQKQKLQEAQALAKDLAGKLIK